MRNRSFVARKYPDGVIAHDCTVDEKRTFLGEERHADGVIAHDCTVDENEADDVNIQQVKTKGALCLKFRWHRVDWQRTSRLEFYC